MTVSAIVLAGGRAARFDGDKLAAELEGRSVLELAIDAVRGVADEVLVVGRSGSSSGARYLADERPFEGPLGGLATGLRAGRGDVALVVGGDMPRLRPGVLRLLLAQLDAPAATAAALEEGARPRPLPLALRRDVAAEVAAACLVAGERSLQGFMRRLELRSVPEPEWRALDPAGETLADVDTRADLDRLRRRR
ncbi:MAG TPA: molybdenum cofactor guanylyltransferase [Candidatus Limnocylindrales bacterium]|nr:molybdenum cofactor guanylyltransferase [Candidatus Limnocylindrales bacterium]